MKSNISNSNINNFEELFIDNYIFNPTNNGKFEVNTLFSFENKGYYTVNSKYTLQSNSITEGNVVLPLGRFDIKKGKGSSFTTFNGLVNCDLKKENIFYKESLNEHSKLTNVLVLSYMRIRRGLMGLSTEGKGVLVPRGRGFKRVKLHLKYSKVPFVLLRGSYFGLATNKVAKYVKRYKKRSSNWFINLHVPKYLLQRYMLLSTYNSRSNNTFISKAPCYLSSTDTKNNIVSVRNVSDQLDTKLYKNVYLNRPSTKKNSTLKKGANKKRNNRNKKR